MPVVSYGLVLLVIFSLNPGSSPQAYFPFNIIQFVSVPSGLFLVSIVIFTLLNLILYF